MPSPISCGFGARGAERVVVAVGKRTLAISPEERGHARARLAVDVAADALGQLVALDLDRLRLVNAGRAPDRARPACANGEPAASESPRPNSTSPAARAGAAPIRRTRGAGATCPPRPRPTTSTARAIDSASALGEQVREHRHLAAAPDEVVALPSRVRLTSNTSRSPRRNGAVPSRRPRSARRAARPRRRPGGSRPARVPRSRRMPLSITSPPPTSAENRPAPGRHHQRHVGQHAPASPARSARRAPPDRSPCRRRAASAPPRRRAAGAAAPRATRARDRPPAPASRRSCAAPPGLSSSTARQRRGLTAPAPLGVVDGPAMTTQAIRCSLCVSAGWAAPARVDAARPPGPRSGPSASERRDHRAARRRGGARGSLASIRATSVVERAAAGSGTISRARGASCSRIFASTRSRRRPRTRAARSGTGTARSPARTRRRAASMSRSPRTCSGAM